MRMAGDMDVSSFMSSGPDLGALSQKAFVNDAKEEIGGFKNQAMINTTAMDTFADTSAHAAVTEAKGNYMGAQQQASNMSKVGSLFGQGLGGLSGMFGGGGGGGGLGSGIGLGNSTAMNYDFGNAWTQGF